MKRQVRPPDIRKLVTLPSLGSELHGVGAVEIFASVHVVDYVADAGVFGDEDWGGAVGAAAAGEEGGFLGDADVYGDGGVETEGWVG